MGHLRGVRRRRGLEEDLASRNRCRVCDVEHGDRLQ